MSRDDDGLEHPARTERDARQFRRLMIQAAAGFLLFAAGWGAALAGDRSNGALVVALLLGLAGLLLMWATSRSLERLPRIRR